MSKRLEEFLNEKGLAYEKYDEDYFLTEKVAKHNDDVLYLEVYVKWEDDKGTLTIHDGGCIAGNMFAQFASKDKSIVAKLVAICKKYGISKKGHIFFTKSTVEDFDSKLEKFINAADEIYDI